MDAPAAGPAPSASDASQSAASSAETPSATPTAPDTSTSSQADADTAAQASYFGVSPDGGLPPVGGRVRDPQTGRFVKGSETTPEAGGQQDPPAPDAAPAQPAAPASQKFKLAEGLEFDSPEAAAQQFRTLRGMFKSQDGQLRELRAELTQAINVANAWKATAEGKSATAAPASPASAGAPASAAPTTPAEPDWETVAALAAHADPNIARVGPLVQYHQEAQRLAEAREAALFERLTKEIEAKYSPVLASHAQQADLAEAGAVVDALADWTIEATGQPFFPELRDYDQIAAIGKTWRDAGRDPALLKTQGGLIDAIALHRMWTGYMTPAAPAPAASTPAPPAPPPPPGSAELAMAMAGTAPPNVRPAGPAHPQEAVRAAIRNADRVDSFWGVAP